jgi:RNA polymerase sigma-70 factor (ECF subfamily)
VRPVDDAPDLYRERFERCFREHYARVLAFAMRRVSGRDVAEDVVADTFAVAWRRRDCIPEAPLPWLYAIAGNVIANEYRSTRRRGNLGERLAQEAGTAEKESDPAETIDRRDGFAVAFAALDEAEREVLRLVAWEGLSTREGAQVLGCSAAAFRVRVHRARRKLAKQLEAAGHVEGGCRSAAPEPAEEI